jgi:hypothetical protein
MRFFALCFAVSLMAVAGCKSEGRKATDECLEQKGLDRAEKCSFACATYSIDESTKESCPAAELAMTELCFTTDSNAIRCKDICRTFVLSGQAPKTLSAACTKLTKY